MVTVQGDDVNPAIELLKLHDTQAHRIGNKPDKQLRPTLAMPGDAVEDKDWERFMFMFDHYKKLVGLDTNSSSHLLECLSTEVHDVLFSTYGKEIIGITEADLTSKLKS